MKNVIDIKTGAPIVTGQHTRTAEVLIESGDLSVPDERLATIKVPCGFACMHRNLYGPDICRGCPDNRG